MSKYLYLTIDDSPSAQTDALTDFLLQKNIPAVLFVRGALMEDPQNFSKIVRAIQKGFLIGNHSYAHERTSHIGFDAQTSQITKTQNLIDRAYNAAEKKQPIKTFRFPHLDRGCGNAYVADFENFPSAYRDAAQKLFWDGVRLENTDRPTPAQMTLKNDIQRWLRAEGFETLPTQKVTHPWYCATELGQAVDTLITYSTSDWMILPRHLGKWPYQSLDDLTRKIDSDPWLNTPESANIVLIHDYGEEDSLTHFRKLITYFLNQNFEFINFLAEER